MGLLFPPSIVGGSIVGYIIIIFSFDLSLSLLFFLPFFLVVIIVIIVMVCFNINGTEVYSFESRRGTGFMICPVFSGGRGEEDVGT